MPFALEDGGRVAQTSPSLIPFPQGTWLLVGARWPIISATSKEHPLLASPMSSVKLESMSEGWLSAVLEDHMGESSRTSWDILFN